jgi:hypothetical protein
VREVDKYPKLWFNTVNFFRFVTKNMTVGDGDMLKYIYSGDFPEDPKILITDLLHIADVHQMHPEVDKKHV